MLAIDQKFYIAEPRWRWGFRQRSRGPGSGPGAGAIRTHQGGPIMNVALWIVQALLGLILPGLLRVRPGLTPLAAVGLVLVTIGATAYQLAAAQPASALFALVVGLFCAFVAYGRWRLAPVGEPSRRPALQSE